jgi:hypothetical protein
MLELYNGFFNKEQSKKSGHRKGFTGQKTMLFFGL